MKNFDIWVEGFAITGNSAGASLLSTEEANTWDEAVEKYMAKHPGRINVQECGGKKNYTDWGCRLFLKR